MFYVWEPGPRDDGSWYVWVFRLVKRAANWAFGTFFRYVGGAIESDG